MRASAVTGSRHEGGPGAFAHIWATLEEAKARLRCREETKGRVCKRLVLANVTPFGFLYLRSTCCTPEPRPGFWYRRSFFCTLAPVLGVQGTSAKTTLLETTLLRTPGIGLVGEGLQMAGCSAKSLPQFLGFSATHFPMLYICNCCPEGSWFGIGVPSERVPVGRNSVDGSSRQKEHRKPL